jgi:hypothetical protein
VKQVNRNTSKQKRKKHIKEKIKIKKCGRANTSKFLVHSQENRVWGAGKVV